MGENESKPIPKQTTNDIQNLVQKEIKKRFEEEFKKRENIARSSFDVNLKINPSDKNQSVHNVKHHTQFHENNSFKPLNNQYDKIKSNTNITESMKSFEGNGNNNSNMVTDKHEAFLKKLIAKHMFCKTKDRGFYCSACDFYFVFFDNDPKPSHEESEMHKSSTINKSEIEKHYCETCKAYFFGDKNFWQNHISMELHKTLAFNYKRCNTKIFHNGNKKCIDDKKNGNKNVNDDNLSKNDKILEQIKSLSLRDVLLEQKVEQFSFINLIFKKDVIKNFYNRLQNRNIYHFSYYCHICEFWTDDGSLWDNHTDNHKNDSALTNAKICANCKLVLLGDDILKEFHSDHENHKDFEQFLLFHLNNFKEMEEKNNDYKDCESDVESSDDVFNKNTKKKQKKLFTLLLTDLTSDTTRNDIFLFFKDFGRIEIKMNCDGPSTAKVSFKNRSIARNIFYSKLPVNIRNKKVTVSLC